MPSSDRPSSRIRPLRLVVWTDRLRVPLVRATLAAGGDGIELVGVAAVDASQVATIADALGTTPMPDLRQGVQAHGADVIWLAADAELAVDTIRWLRTLRVTIVASEPQPATLDELDDPHGGGIDGLLSWMNGPTWALATETLQHFGRPDAISILAVGAAEHGSLLTRLCDAMDVADWFCSPVETITASMHGVGAAGATESVRGLHGHLTAHLRGADGRNAAIAVSSDGSGWLRELTLFGAAGRLRITDAEFTWLDPSGTILDSHTGGPSDAPRLAAQRLRELVNETARPSGAPASSRLAFARTALLSCRTGHSESCQRVAKALGGR